MKSHYKSLIPSSVFYFFDQLNQIPRPSWHEEQVISYLKTFAEERGLHYRIDAHGCVVIEKNASPGYEQSLPIVLLAHMDMVCVADKEKNFNPLADPIEAYVEEGWIKARGTSLGADNGIGLAMMLAILDDISLKHGAIECLITTNEEDGMTGGANLSAHTLKGRWIVNVDSEEFDTITIGSAGAYLETSSWLYQKEELPKGYQPVTICFTGGKGGHSGFDIHRNHANANKLLGEFLFRYFQEISAILLSFEGGQASNAIAATATASIAIPIEKITHLNESIEKFNREIAQQYAASDPHIQLSSEVSPENNGAIPAPIAEGLLRMIHACPCGIIRMSEKLKETPYCSNNIGLIQTSASQITLSTYSRSFNNKEVIALGKKIEELCRKHGGSTEIIMNAPGWEADLNSELLAYTIASFESELHFRPRLEAMHAALECGYLTQLYPDCEIVSIGPKIVGAHSIAEAVNCETIEKIWRVLLHLLQAIASKKPPFTKQKINNRG